MKSSNHIANRQLKPTTEEELRQSCVWLSSRALRRLDASGYTAAARAVTPASTTLREIMPFNDTNNKTSELSVNI